MSLPQQQIRFKQSRKLCLNLRSLRWLKPNLSLLISFIPIELWQLKVLSGVGQTNCKILFFKRARLSELITLSSRLFHSSTVDGKNEFLKKVAVIIYFVCNPSSGDFIKEILWGLVFSYLWKKANFPKPLPLF